MQKKNSKLVDVTMVPRIVELADSLFETYLRDWARVTEWRADGNAGYPTGGLGGGGGSSELNGLPMCGARYLDVERLLVHSRLVRPMLEQMYLGTGMTVNRYVDDECRGFDRWTRELMAGAMVDCFRRWRRSSASELGLFDFAAERLMDDGVRVPVGIWRGVSSVNVATADDYRAAGLVMG